MASVLWMALVAVLVIKGDNNHQLKVQCKQYASVISQGDRDVYRQELNECLENNQ